MAKQTDDGKRDLILESAFEVFGELGFESTTIKHIAREAGISAGSIYNYFRDKEDLFISTVERGWNRFLDELRITVSSPRSYYEKFISLIDFGMDLLKKAYPLLRGMLFGSNQRDLLHEKLEQLWQEMDALILEGKKRGIIEVSEDRRQRQFGLKTIVLGIMLSVSLAQPERLDQEIETIKAGIAGLFRVGYQWNGAGGGATEGSGR